MSPILSRTVPVFDITADGFQGAARDIGEVIAYLAGGIRPDAETISRLSISMRALQGFLLQEALQQASREAISAASPFFPVTTPVVVRPNPYAPQAKSRDERHAEVSA